MKIILRFLTGTSMAETVKPTLLACQGWDIFAEFPTISQTPACTDSVRLVSEATKILLLFVSQK